jgi:hypothetical protein
MPEVDVRRRAIVLMVIALLEGCSSGSYPMPSGPPGAGQTSPATLGTPVPGVVLWLQPRPGDRFELLSVEPIGVDPGATVRFFLSRMVLKPDGTRLIGEQREALAGALIATASNASPGPDNDVGIVAEITADKPGRYTLTSLRLHYRLNGGSEEAREGIDVIFTVCAADPAPTDCVQEDPAG